MCRLAALPSPDLPEIKHARQRWAAYVDKDHDLGILDGDTLLHTDFNPLSILLSPDQAPTRHSDQRRRWQLPTPDRQRPDSERSTAWPGCRWQGRQCGG